MVRILDLELYVGTKEEYSIAKNLNMAIVCALRNANGFVSHQSVVGWGGRGCDPNHPHYLFKREDDAIYLNMIDGDDPRYVSDKMIDPALRFINEKLSESRKVFVYCSLGESRSPSIALMYLLEQGLLERSHSTLEKFKREIYPAFNPKSGNLNYLIDRWNLQ